MCDQEALRASRIFTMGNQYEAKITQSPFKKDYYMSQFAPHRSISGMSWHNHVQNGYLCSLEEIIPSQRQMRFCLVPCLRYPRAPFTLMVMVMASWTVSVRVTGLQGVWPLLNENCWKFLSGIQRVENETYLFFLWILLGTQHGYPGWDLTPRTT